MNATQAIRRGAGGWVITKQRDEANQSPKMKKRRRSYRPAALCKSEGLFAQTRLGRPLPDDQPAPRLCYLTRSNNQEYYGFDLKSSKTSGKHTLSNIKKESVAYRAGLRNEDFVLEINGAPVDGLPRDQVVSRILQNPKQLEILVLSQGDKQSLDSLKLQKQVAKSATESTLVAT